MIQDVFGGPTSDPATVQASVEQLSDTERPSKMRELTKSFILDPTKRIELDDLIRSETQRVLTELKSAERFPLQPAAGQADRDADLLIAELSTDYWRLIEPLCWSLQVAARYADTVEQLTPWTRALVALHTYAVEPVGGRAVLIKLRYVPLLACVVTAAAAAVGDDRWDNFRRLLIDCTVKLRQGDNRVESIAEAVDFYAPFTEAGKSAPSALAYTAGSEKYTLESALTALRAKNIQYRLQPVADWLCEMLRPMFTDQFADSDAYENAFDRAEVMLGLVTEDSISMLVERNPELSWLRGTHWFGRSTWRHKHSNSSPVNEFAQQLDTAGADYGPLRAGLFGGQQERAEAAMTSYAEQFAKVSRGYW
ncbi:hypothetical protein [Rhodococcus baikonurensis]|uniref:Uncharacterized protein n=1 Tax=Rhodococcus baikonurensis TaxID=172041 RepID=A0ABV5XM12_9NOCA